MFASWQSSYIPDFLILHIRGVLRGRPAMFPFYFFFYFIVILLRFMTKTERGC
jgi:hypothetical protein